MPNNNYSKEKIEQGNDEDAKKIPGKTLKELITDAKINGKKIEKDKKIFKNYANSLH